MSVLQEYKIGETGTKITIVPDILENRKSEVSDLKNPLVNIITNVDPINVNVLDPNKINIIESKSNHGKFELDSKIISEKIVKIYVPEGMLIHLRTGNYIYSFYGFNEYVRLYFMDGSYKIIDGTQYLNVATFEVELKNQKIDKLFLIDNYVVFSEEQKLDCFKLKNGKLEPHPVLYNCDTNDIMQFGEDFFSLQNNKLIVYMNKLEPTNLFSFDERFKNINICYIDLTTNNCIFKSDLGIHKVNFVKAEYELLTFNKIGLKISSNNFDNLEKYN
jgi:hypothetical protein